jgi:hypothetical protein
MRIHGGNTLKVAFGRFFLDAQSWNFKALYFANAKYRLKKY